MLLPVYRIVVHCSLVKENADLSRGSLPLLCYSKAKVGESLLDEILEVGLVSWINVIVLLIVGIMEEYDAVCVATWIKNGDMRNPVDPDRTRYFMEQAALAEVGA